MAETPTLGDGRIRLREPLPGVGPAVLNAEDEEGRACFVEVVPEEPGLRIALHNLATRGHPTLPVILDQTLVEDRFLLAEDPGPGQPLSQALGHSWAPWTALRVARVLPVLCEGLDLLHRETGGLLPARLTPSDLWLTPQGTLRLRVFGLGLRAQASPDKSVRMAEAMQDLVRTLGRLAPAAATGEFLWILARCDGANLERTYRGFAELGEALRRPATEKTQRMVQASPTVVVRAPPPRPSRARPILAVLLALALLAGLTWRWLQPAPRPVHEPALAIGVGRAVDFHSRISGKLLSRIELPESPGGLATTMEGDLVFATQPRAGRLSVLDVRQGRYLGDLILDPDPRALVRNLEGNLLFAVHPARSLVTVIDLQPHRLLPGLLPVQAESIVATEGPQIELACGVQRTLRGSTPILYLSSSGSVTAMGLRPTRLLAHVDFPDAGAVALSPGGRRLYVALQTRPEVAILDASTLERIETWPLLRPAVRLLQVGRSLWAVDLQGRLEQVDTPGPTLRLPFGIWKAVAPEPRTNLLWVLGGDPSCLLGLDPSRSGTLGLIPVPRGSAQMVIVPCDSGLPGPQAPGR